MSIQAAWRRLIMRTLDNLLRNPLVLGKMLNRLLFIEGSRQNCELTHEKYNENRVDNCSPAGSLPGMFVSVDCRRGLYFFEQFSLLVNPLLGDSHHPQR